MLFRSANTYTEISRFATGPGGRTGLFIPEQGLLLVATPRNDSKDARLDSLLTGGSGISKQVLQTIDCPDININRVKVLKKWQMQNRRGVDVKRMSTDALGTAWQPTSIRVAL